MSCSMRWKIARCADCLVIGRQITRAADPAREASRILEQIGAASLMA